MKSKPFNGHVNAIIITITFIINHLRVFSSVWSFCLSDRFLCARKKIEKLIILTCPRIQRVSFESRLLKELSARLLHPN